MNFKLIFVGRRIFVDATQVLLWNLIGRNWRSWERNRITPTYLNP